MENKQSTLKAFTIILSLLVLAGPLLPFGDAQAVEKQKGPEEKAVPASTITGIQLSFKLDPRLTDSTYGGERWVSAPTYVGANAQDTVEARAKVIDAKGQPTKTSPEWIPSDPEMVTVSPSQGYQVKIIVHRAGESKLKVAAQGFYNELVVKAKYVGKAIQVEITQPAVGKSDGAGAAQNAPAFKSQKEKLSYAVGMNVAKALQKQSVEVDADLLMQGFKDALSGSQTLMNEEQVRATLIGVQADRGTCRPLRRGKNSRRKTRRKARHFWPRTRRRKGW